MESLEISILFCLAAIGLVLFSYFVGKKIGHLIGKKKNSNNEKEN